MFIIDMNNIYNTIAKFHTNLFAYEFHTNTMLIWRRYWRQL